MLVIVLFVTHVASLAVGAWLAWTLVRGYRDELAAQAELLEVREIFLDESADRISLGGGRHRAAYPEAPPRPFVVPKPPRLRLPFDPAPIFADMAPQRRIERRALVSLLIEAT